MGPPRRNDQGKSPKKVVNGQQHQQPPPPPPPPVQAAQSPPSMGMTTAARYQHNLNVMRRRDPSIQTIFDQFDHVCIYLQEEAGKWQKIGVEGSLFLFESNTYPPYGFYVLNRAGSSDYIQRLYPEDEYGAIGEIIGIKSYPEFTLKRMAELRARNGDQPLTDPFSSTYKIPSALTPAMKGEKRTIGVWRHPESEVPQNREKMLDVIKRLYGCVRRHEAYPEEFRYGPNHPPPPHRLRATNRRRGEDESSQSDTGASDSGAPSDAPSNSEIDALFSKFMPSAPKAPVKTPLDSLFAKLSTDGATHSAPVTPAPASTGISLLDSIFASASKSQASLPIHSPTPSVSTAPQVLNQDVISTLLGLAPSRTASAASNTHSAGGTSRDGDNEEDSDSSGGRSVPPAMGGLLTVPAQGKVRGDATPRGFTTKSIPINGQNRVPAPSVLESVSSIATVRPSYPTHRSSSSTVTDSPNNVPATSDKAKPRANRELVPFEDDSVLWPYTPSHNGADTGSDDPDTVELDFSDTSFLSDPDGFKKLEQQAPLRPRPIANGSVQPKEKRSRNRKKSKKERDAEERADIESSWDVPEYCSSYVASQRAGAEARKQFLNSPPASPSPPTSPQSSSAASGAEVVHTPPPRAQENGYGHQQQALVDAQTPTMGPRKIPVANGRAVGQAPGTPSKAKKAAVNGVSNANAGHVDKDLVQSTIVDEIQAQSRNLGKMERNDFVREVLTLIHTDKGFVDGLYQRYNSQLA